MDAQRSYVGASAGTTADTSASTDSVELLRRWLLALLVLGLVGTVTELILLSHYEQPLQLAAFEPAHAEPRSRPRRFARMHASHDPIDYGLTENQRLLLCPRAPLQLVFTLQR